MPPELITVPGGRRRAAVAALVAAVAGLLLLVPAAAHADGGLVAANPPAGAVLGVAPAEVTLDFSASVDEGRSHVSVLDGASRTVADGTLTRSGDRRLRVSVRTVPAGDYTIAYHVTFTDGASITGAHRFSVGTGIQPAPLAVAAQGGGTDTVTTHAHAHRIDGFSAFLLIVDGAVLAVVLALLWLRPRGGQPSPRADLRP